MNRRDFCKHNLLLGMGVLAGVQEVRGEGSGNQAGGYYEEPPKKLPVRKFDVVVVGGGTAGVAAVRGGGGRVTRIVLSRKRLGGQPRAACRDCPFYPICTNRR